MASGGIEDVSGVSSDESGNLAQAQVLVTLKNRSKVLLTFPLVEENGEWKIASIEPMWQLAQATRLIRLLDL
jgi:hypothetical protein